MSLVEVKVPDIGDFKDVDVIEVSIKPGDVVEKEQSLLTLESDKATMEVPSDTAGTVKEVKIKPGDKVSQGTVIAVVETKEEAGAVKAEPAAAPPAPAPAPAVASPSAAAAPQAESYTGGADIECDMVVLGAGPGGYSAAFRSADLGMKTVLVERYSTLGGVCLNVGCIPSKALLHTALIMDEVGELAEHGIMFGEAKIDLPKLRSFKSGVVKKLTTGLAGMAKARKVEVVTGVGSFIDPHHMEVQTEGGKKVVKFKQAIIAAGSQAVKLPFMPDDPRVIDSTGALELPQIPQRMLVVGGGIIGLEMATVYATLGAKIDVVEMLDGLMTGADRDLVKVWQKYSAGHFANVMLKTKTTSAEAKPDGIYVSFEGESAPAGPQRYDLVLVAVGRSPNGKKIGAQRAGVAVTERGFIEVDKQMRTNVPHIFAIGDVVGQPMLAHKAVHEGHVAAEAAHGEKAYFDALQIP
jgi:dihydrolipoamide dehydrogenase